MARMARHAALIGSLAALALGFAACGDDNEGGGGATTGGGGGTTVAVTLQEYAVLPDSDSAPAGEITFDPENTGTEEHEFVVVRTDLAPDALPTTEEGIVDEEGEGIEIVDEVEALQPGDSGSVTVDADAGSYVLICNVLDEEGDAHYALGMRTAFTVE